MSISNGERRARRTRRSSGTGASVASRKKRSESRTWEPQTASAFPGRGSTRARASRGSGSRRRPPAGRGGEPAESGSRDAGGPLDSPWSGGQGNQGWGRGLSRGFRCGRQGLRTDRLERMPSYFPTATRARFSRRLSKTGSRRRMAPRAIQKAAKVQPAVNIAASNWL